jgi:PST family polysaccharide transporter
MDLDVYGGGKKTMMDLKQKVVTGIKWSAVSQMGRQGTQLLTTVILARLLSPSDFGLLAMAMVVMGFINIFKDLGTSAAIIQQKELSKVLLSSIFWVNVVFGLTATIILFLLSPLFGMFYQESGLIAVLQLLSLSFFVSGLGTAHQALLERSLLFSVLTRLELVSAIAGGIVGIVLALLGAGVWSLVVQSLASTITTTVLLWLSSPWRPRALFGWEEIKRVISFTLNLTGFNLINYLIRNADYLLIGRYLGAQDLGYYTLAYRILLFPIQNISAVIGRVLYPVLSSIQDDHKRFVSIYLKIAANIAFVTFPLMLGVLALAGPFVLTVFGEKWQPVILLIQVFAPVGLAQSVGATVGIIYQAKGRTDWLFRWGLGAGSLVMIAFMIGIMWGITGVAVAYALATFMLLYPSFAIPFRLIDLKIVQMFRGLLPSLLNSSLMFLMLMLLRIILPASVSNVIILVLFTSVGFTIYALASWLTNRGQLRELWNLTGLGRRNIHETG